MKLYRYSDWIDEPYLEEFEVIKTTKCGHWIMDTCQWPEKKKWINKGTRKQYAYMTQELALNSYVKRKERQIIILEIQLEKTKRKLKIAKNIDLSTKLLEYKSSITLSFDEVFNSGGF